MTGSRDSAAILRSGNTAFDARKMGTSAPACRRTRPLSVMHCVMRGRNVREAPGSVCTAAT